MQKYIVTLLIIGLMFSQSYFFGSNDSFTAVIVLITSVFLYSTLIKIQVKNRRTLRVNTVKDSFLYNFLSQEVNLLTRVIVFCSSLILSMTLVVSVKGIALQQGNIPFFIVIALSSIFIYSLADKEISSKKINENIHPDITNYGNELVGIFYSAILINLMLTMVFSANDTFLFKTTDVSFDNFIAKTLEQSIEETDKNEYGRVFINAYLLMDNIKVALTKLLLHQFNLESGFYNFYVVIFILNLFKMSAFSFSFVLLQRGFLDASDSLKNMIEVRKIMEFTSSKVYSLFKNTNNDLNKKDIVNEV